MRYILSAIIVSLFFFSCIKDRVQPPAPPIQQPPVNVGSRVLIDYWNFNNDATTASLIAPTYTVGGGTLIIDADSTDSYVPSPALTTPTPNAQHGDSTGALLRVRNPSTNLIIAAPTTGYKNVLISYAVATSSTTSGVLTDSVFYTTDGTHYVNTGLSVVTYSVPVDPAYTLETFDLSSVTAANNNANFKFKIVFANGNLGAKGNTRFDNITVDADSLNATGSNPPVISSAATASGTVGTTFTYSIIASATPTSYAVGGTLPGGLNINTTTGVISGTPTTAGTFIDTLKAINAAGTGVRVLTITIAPPLVPVISSGATATATIGSAFTYTIVASNTPTSYAVGGTLPLGLTIDLVTGIISGTPTTAGTVIDTVKAINAFGTGTQVVTFTITAATPVLLHYWNFNSTASATAYLDPSSSIGGGALNFDFTTVGSTLGYRDSVASTANTQNAQNGDVDGNALRIRNPVLDFIITAPTTGYKNIVLSFAEDASSASKAAMTNTVAYTLDGTNYISTGLTTTSYSLSAYIDPTFGLESFDFSSITGANDNPNFKIKITFSSGNLNTSGNDRIDNLTVIGVAK